MKESKLLSSYNSHAFKLNNRVVMAPMTRSRAIGNIPNELMARYYALRASTGLIVTEGTSPSKNGLGYPNIPGVYSEEQVAGWRKVTEAVHEAGGKIFLQIMHVGRIAHELNLPEGGEIIAPSPIAAPGEMFTPEGPKPNGMPREMTIDDIRKTQQKFVISAKNAIKAGFDGVEIHSANGYLPNQFINRGSNKRQDEYGGSIENRCRFVLEISQQVAEAIGKDKTGIRISPYGVFNDMQIYDEIPETYQYLIEQLNQVDLAYVHIANMTDKAPEGFLEKLGSGFKNTVIFNGGYGNDLPSAERLVSEKHNALVAIGVPFIANPDLIERIRQGAEFAQPDTSTFYTPGTEGYLTYPTLKGVTS